MDSFFKFTPTLGAFGWEIGSTLIPNSPTPPPPPKKKPNKSSTFIYVHFQARKNPLPAIEVLIRRWKGVRRDSRPQSHFSICAHAPSSYMFTSLLQCMSFAFVMIATCITYNNIFVHVTLLPVFSLSQWV